MNTFTSIFEIIQSLFSKKEFNLKLTFKRLKIITLAILTMSGKKNIKNISRWTEKGGSYQTLLRFFHEKETPWTLLNLFLIKAFSEPEDRFLLVGDITIVPKSGKITFGKSRFHSTIASRRISSVAFLTISIVNINMKKSWPVATMQVIKDPKKQKEKIKKQKKRGPGRPKGSKNKTKKDVVLKGEMKQVSIIFTKYLELIRKTMPNILPYFVYDGAFGNNAAAEMTKKFNLTLISKFRYDSALFYKFSGKYSGTGRPKTYGDKINLKSIRKEFEIPKEQLELFYKKQKDENGNQVKVYQFQALKISFDKPINIVVIETTNQHTKKLSRTILFTSDLKLKWNEILSYYHLRFQIEFNFRDAKQHWGLRDFMTIKETSIFNSVNLSMFMVNFSQIMLFKSNLPVQSILDLKSHFHGIKYANETLKLLPEKIRSKFKEPILKKLSSIGQIHSKLMIS